MDKKTEKKIEEEVKKRLHEKIYHRTKQSAVKFKKEFRRELVIAITAAFGFLIALSWRNPIQKTIDAIIKNLGLTGQAVYIEYLSALVITLLAVLVLMLVSKWKSGED